MQFDINVVGLLALVLGGFSLFVRLTIRAAIADLKESLTLSYVPRTELEVRLAAIEHRLIAAEASSGCIKIKPSHAN